MSTQKVVEDLIQSYGLIIPGFIRNELIARQNIAAAESSDGRQWPRNSFLWR